MAIVIVLVLSTILQFSPNRVFALTEARADNTRVVAKPGDKVHFNIWLNYTASQPLSSITYSLEVRNLPIDWISHIWYQIQTPTTSVKQDIRGLTVSNYITYRKVEQLDLEIEVPNTAKPGHYSFWFLAVGKEIPNEAVILEFSIDVEEPKRELKLSCLYPNLTVEREGTAKFTIVLSNTGETDELANLSAEAPEGWRVVFKGQTSSVFGVYIPKGQATELQVEVALPEGVAAGTYGIRVCANSSDQVANSTLQLKVAVVKAGSVERMVSTLYPEVSVEAGRTMYFPITIRNTAESSSTFHLSTISAPEGWTLSFRTEPSELLSVSSVFLEAGESTTLYLEAAPPATVAIGTYEFTVKVTSEEGMSEYLTTKAQVTGSYEVTLDLETLYARARAGESSTISATVRNTGQTRLTNVTLEVSPPEGWQVIQTPNYIDILAPGERGTITLVIKPPKDAEVGDYMVGVKCISDRAKSTQLLLRVNVQSPSVTLWMIGILSIVVAAILIVAVYVKFARKS